MDPINYLRYEDHFCPRCEASTSHMVTDEAFENALGYICKKCGLVWHFNPIGGPCPHGELSKQAMRMATRKKTDAEKKAEAEAERKLAEYLGKDVMKCLEHETKNYDLFWRLEQ